MHAAGGAFVSKQLSKESSGCNQNQPVARKGRISLTQAEDFKLTTWMHQRQPKWGEKATDICLEAVAELGLPHLNKDHIYTRIAAHEATLPKAPAPVAEATIIERLRDAERFNATLYEMVFNGHVVSPEEGAWLSGYVAQFRTRLKSL
jgi:hypothetical protein